MLPEVTKENVDAVAAQAQGRLEEYLGERLASLRLSNEILCAFICTTTLHSLDATLHSLDAKHVMAVGLMTAHLIEVAAERQGVHGGGEDKPPVADLVVLNSGGQVMSLECVEGDNAVVSWSDPDGRRQRKIVPAACLSRLVPLVS